MTSIFKAARWILLSATAVAVIGGAATCSRLTQAVSDEDSMLQLFPRDTDSMLFADIAGLRGNPLIEELVREQARTRIPPAMTGFSDWTGLNFRTDVDQVAVGAAGSDELLAVLRARYDPERVASYFSDNNFPVATYGGRLIYHPDPDQSWKLSFVEGYVLLGQDRSIRGAIDRIDRIDRIESPDSTALDNVDLVDQLRAIRDGYHIWAVGRPSASVLSDEFAAPQMAVDLFGSLERGTYQMRLDDAVTGRAVGEFATPEVARRTSNLLQGLVTLGRIQAGRWPGVRELLDGLEIEDVESAVHLTFAVDSDVLRLLTSSAAVAEN